MEEGEEDESSNPSVIVTFQCYDCDLEYIGVYHITQLICGTPNEGGGEFPLDFQEGKKLFK
jgi:hypothetical protein